MTRLKAHLTGSDCRMSGIHIGAKTPMMSRKHQNRRTINGVRQCSFDVLAMENLIYCNFYKRLGGKINLNAKVGPGRLA